MTNDFLNQKEVVVNQTCLCTKERPSKRKQHVEGTCKNYQK